MRKNSGQLAVGLAFGFACILAMFGLIFNFGQNTRDKMKMQTMTDYATMVAANTQKLSLNVIRQNNKAIEKEWAVLAPLLQIPYCSALITESSSVYSVVEARVNAFIGANASTPIEVNEQTGGGPCDIACDRYDNKIKSMAIQVYRSFQAEYFSNIKSILEKTNPAAYNDALNTLLDPKSLPSGLYFQLQKKLGKSFKVKDVRRLYDGGELIPDGRNNYGYDILANDQDALFEAKLETKKALHMNYFYSTYTGADQNLYCTPSPAGLGLPKHVSLPYRVYKSSDYTTQFFAKTTYLAPPNIIERMFNLGVKNPDASSEKFGENNSGSFGKEKLFSKKFPYLQAVAASKPYGGAFPKRGIAGWGGTSGKEFKGSKLFGLADTEEIGGERIDRLDSSIANTDSQGNLSNKADYFVEDFLH